MDGLESLNTLFAIGGVFVVFMLLFVVAIYLLCALAFYKYLKWVGYTNPYFAFIPYVSSYALAVTCDEDAEGNVDIFGLFSLPKNLFVWYWALQLACSFIPVVGTILSFVIGLIGTVKVYSVILSRLDNKSEKDELVMAIISYFIPIIVIIKCFTGCNTPKSEV